MGDVPGLAGRSPVYIARQIYHFRNDGRTGANADIRIPIFENTGVFQKSIGETTDIVEKEMYTFTDRGGESLTLRPEGTASVVRSYVEHTMYTQVGPVKLFYMGPMFRAERPQAGRFRQFHQIGAEVFGSDDPAVDAEIIIMLMDMFGDLDVSGLKVRLDSLGCEKCRPAHREALYRFLKDKTGSLCDNCQSRVERNPLRVLDCKSSTCKEVAQKAPTIDRYRCADCEEHFGAVVRAEPGVLSGRVLYSDGTTPASGSVVRVWDREGARFAAVTHTDAGGVYSAEVPEGRHVIIYGDRVFVMPPIGGG